MHSGALHYSGMSYPPCSMHNREAEVINDSVVVIILMGMDLGTNREALEAEVKIGANCAFDPRDIAYIFCTEVAMVEVPAREEMAKYNIFQIENRTMEHRDDTAYLFESPAAAAGAGDVPESRPALGRLPDLQSVTDEAKQ